jgi:hypothetical protein
MKLNYRVVIGGICKNVDSTIERTLQKIVETGGLFSNFKAVIYENNSTDGTKYILNKYRGNHQFIIISEDYSPDELLQRTFFMTWDGKPCRIELLSLARNRFIDEIQRHNLQDWDYLMIIDLDLCDWDLNGIIDSFHCGYWDCVAANCIMPDGRYRDAYAYRDKQYPFGPELLGGYWWDTLCPQIQRVLPNDGLIPVFSTFGGLAIYRMASVKGCKYSTLVTPAFHTVTKRIWQEGQYNHDYRTVMETLKNSQDPQGIHSDSGIFYVNNSGYEYPVVCEHVNFHSQMIVKGFNKLYINPKMVIHV